jgi:deoxyribodipyrimidine photolyase
VLWFRRDLRLGDHPALLAALDSAGPNGTVVPLFVFDEGLWGPSGDPRRRFLLDCLTELREQTGGALVLRCGDPVRVVPHLVADVGAGTVHVSAEAGPYGRRRDDAVERALGDVPLLRTGSPYAVTPGRVTKAEGTPFKVFTPFARAWRTTAGAGRRTVRRQSRGRPASAPTIRHPPLSSPTSPCPRPVRPPRQPPGHASATSGSRATTTPATPRGSTAPAGCRPT